MPGIENRKTYFIKCYLILSTVYIIYLLFFWVRYFLSYIGKVFFLFYFFYYFLYSYIHYYCMVCSNLCVLIYFSIFNQDLKDYMRQAGEVTYADAHKQRRNEGYIFFVIKIFIILVFSYYFFVCYSVVEFASYSDMKNAIEKLDGTDLNGRRIRLIEDKRRGSGRRSRSSSSRSRSRSRSRRRTRSRSRSR